MTHIDVTATGVDLFKAWSKDEVASRKEAVEVSEPCIAPASVALFHADKRTLRKQRELLRVGRGTSPEPGTGARVRRMGPGLRVCSRGLKGEGRCQGEQQSHAKLSKGWCGPDVPELRKVSRCNALRGPLPNLRMQPTGRSAPSSARALIADGDQWNVGLCGRGHDRPQLMRKSLGRHAPPPVCYGMGAP